MALQAICSSQFSVAFIPEAIRLHSRSETAQQSVCRTSTCRWAYQRATAPQGRSTSKDPSIRRQQQSCLPAVVRQLPKSLLSSSHGEGDVGEVSGAVASAMDDPFRPEKASLSPMVINALVPVLFQEVKTFSLRVLCTHVGTYIPSYGADMLVSDVVIWPGSCRTQRL